MRTAKKRPGSPPGMGPSHGGKISGVPRHRRPSRCPPETIGVSTARGAPPRHHPHGGWVLLQRLGNIVIESERSQRTRFEHVESNRFQRRRSRRARHPAVHRLLGLYHHPAAIPERPPSASAPGRQGIRSHIAAGRTRILCRHVSILPAPRPAGSLRGAGSIAARLREGTLRP